MLTSTIFSAIVLASGSMAQNYGGGNSWSSSMPMAASMPMATSSSAAMAVASSTWAAWPASSSTPGKVMVQVVQVSNANGSSLRYYPEKLQAPPGSWVQFQFYPKNHTVTQSTFGNPCVPINSVMSNVTGIKSGFMPVAPNAMNIPVFSVLVNDTNPIWLYCGQAGHCQKGMAMVINEKPESGKTLEAYKAAAAMVGSGTSSTMTMSSSMPMMTSSMPMMSSSMMMSTSSMMMMSTSIPTMVPTSTKAGPATFTGAANREAVGSSGLAGLLFAGLAFLL